MSLYVAPWCRNSFPPLHDSNTNSPGIDSIAPTAPYTLRSASLHFQTKTRRSDLHHQVQPYKSRDKTPRQAQPLNDAPHTSFHLTQQQHNHNASPTLPPALCAALQQTNTCLTLPQHHPTPLQPSYAHQTRRPNGQCLQPKPDCSERTCQTFHRWVLFTQ